MKYAGLIVLTAMWSSVALSAPNMSFHGTLIEPPCTINNDQTIDVPFGEDLGVNKIDGTNYLKAVDYQITCNASYSANNLAIVIDTANPTVFDDSAVRTSKSGLGIRILVDSQPVMFGERIAVNNLNSPPLIQAVPVRDPAVSLTEGPFEATLTLRSDYL
ncbi:MULTISPECIES: fimbrial protein [Atlantibacter]|uniref:fimbrial protein n=1 Tax=Atlantibacter TaxID=1903434 RepID=UPI0011CD7991|nr:MULTISPECIES: fimbrial protein [Atlantibacter]